jgi:hypothetical protein
MGKREALECRNGENNVTNPNVSASILQPGSGGIVFCFVLLPDTYRDGRTKLCSVTDRQSCGPLQPRSSYSRKNTTSRTLILYRFKTQKEPFYPVSAIGSFARLPYFAL